MNDERFTVVRDVDVPRGGWTLRFPETGVTLKSGSLNTLTRMARSHMENNGIDLPPRLREWVEDQACRRLDPVTRQALCAPESGWPQPTPRSWTREDVRRFLVTVGGWLLKTGFRFAPQAEAESRAAICAGCPENTKVAGCLGCGGVLALVDKLRRDRTTRHDARLDQCGVCGCELKVKVHLPREALVDDGLAYPEHCWQRADGDKGQRDEEGAGDPGDDQLGEG